MLLGREKEIGKLVENLRLGRHTLVLGPAGVGKTALLEAASILLKRSFPSELSVIYLRRCESRRKLLLGALGQLSSRISVKRDSRIGRGAAGKRYARIPELRNCLIGAAGRKRICLLMDHVQRLRHPMQHLLELLDSSCTLVCAIRARPDEHDLYFCKFDKIELGNLPRETALRWIESELGLLGYCRRQKTRIAREILRLTKGHPKSCSDTLRIIRKQDLQIDDPIKVRRMFVDGLLSRLDDYALKSP
jgi:hypothetical protein